MTLENNGMALQGLKILDTSQLFAGAMPATLMGDFGAEVIKVEHPKNGDGLAIQRFDGQIGIFENLHDVSPVQMRTERRVCSGQVVH